MPPDEIDLDEIQNAVVVESAKNPAPRINAAGDESEIFTTFAPSKVKAGVVRTGRHQYMDGIFKRNRSKQADPNYGKWRDTDGKEVTGRVVADIPTLIIEHWMKQGISIFEPNDMPKIIKMLNDKDWSYLRTTTTKIGKAIK